MSIPISDYEKILADIPDETVGDEGFAVSDADEAVLSGIVSRNEKPVMSEAEIKNY